MQYFLDIVKKLENRSNEERKNTIIKILKNKKIKFRLEEYDHQRNFNFSETKDSLNFPIRDKSSFLNYFETKGKNIIVEIGKGKKYSIACAHYDAVPRSPGANDDASAIAVLFKLIENLRKIKLKNKIRIIFFGDEEIGRLGSIAYIKKHGLNNLTGVYHMELVGMGDGFGLWPITKFNENSYIIKNIEQILRKKNIYWERVGNLPAFYGDDLSFREHGFKHAICISVVYKKDKEKIKSFVKSSIPMLIIKYNLGLIPKMFKLYHSKNDKSIYLNESAMEMTAEVLTDSLINLDKEF